MIVGYRKRRAEHAPIHIDRALVDRVECFKFLGVYITNTVVKRARQGLFPSED